MRRVPVARATWRQDSSHFPALPITNLRFRGAAPPGAAGPGQADHPNEGPSANRVVPAAANLEP